MQIYVYELLSIIINQLLGIGLLDVDYIPKIDSLLFCIFNTSTLVGLHKLL